MKQISLSKLTINEPAYAQRGYNRGCLGPISDMDFQFLAIWAELKKIGADYERLRAVFHVFMGKKRFFLKTL